MGSVSQIGWEWFRRLEPQCQLTLLTHKRNQTALEAAGAPLGDSQIIYIDSEFFAGPLYRLASWLFPHSEHPRFLIASADFFVFDYLAWAAAKRLIDQGQHFDVVHQVTPVSPMAATRLHRLDLPLVLGPWNGGMDSPNTFPEIMKKESKWLYPIRNLGRIADTLLGSTRKARLIFTATQATLKTIPSRYQTKCSKLLENGVNLDWFQAVTFPMPPSDRVPLHVLFVGRLLPFKGVEMLLEAVKQLNFPVRVSIVGEGPERKVLEALAEQPALHGKIHFTGNVPLQDIATILQQAHVFCLPSIRESGGAVLLEAMAVARPVIAVDFGGPAEIVDDAVGALLPASGREHLIQRLVQLLEDVRQNPVQWRQRGEQGRKRVESLYSWDAKISIALSHYQRLTEETPP
jgi:glycosyltransferase involved in cell wall biosynthesis